MQKRMIWYSHLEQLAICVNVFVSAKPEERMQAETALRERFAQVRRVHHLVTPATITDPEVERERAKAAGVDEDLRVLREAMA